MTQPIKTHLTCPHCGHKECYSVWADGSYYCHSCQAKPEGFKPQLKEEKLKEEVKSYRGLKGKGAKFYGITTGLNDKGEDVYR